MTAGVKWVFTPKILDEIADYSKRGMTEESIARLLDLDPATFAAKKKLYPEIDRVIKAGRSTGENIAAGVVWRIMSDDTHKQQFSAAVFYLKTRHHWSEYKVETTEHPSLPTGIPLTPAKLKAVEKAARSDEVIEIIEDAA